MIEKIISGGQSGVDKAALRAAKAVGLETGGCCPRGWRTENGTDLELIKFGLIEHPRPEYPPRTQQNVHRADATLIIAKRPLSGGSSLTASYARRARKPLQVVWNLDETSLENTLSWLFDYHLQHVKVLNVAGSRESSWPGIEADAEKWLKILFKEITPRGVMVDGPSIERG